MESIASLEKGDPESAAQRKAIFEVVLASGEARVICYGVSRWHEMQDAIGDLDVLFEAAYSLADLYHKFWPHRAGLSDAVHLALPALHRTADQYLEAACGEEPRYLVHLWDSPALVDNLKLLSRCPGLWGVTLETKQKSPELTQALEKLRHLPHLKVNPHPSSEPYVGLR